MYFTDKTGGNVRFTVYDPQEEYCNQTFWVDLDMNGANVIRNIVKLMQKYQTFTGKVVNSTDAT